MSEVTLEARLLKLAELLSQPRKVSENVKAAVAKRPKTALSLLLTLSALIAYRVKVLLRRKNEEKSKSRILHRRDSATPLDDGSYEIFIPYKDTHKRIVISPISPLVFDSHKRLFLSRPRGVGAQLESKIGINKRFFRQFSAILAIIVPSIRCKEMGLLVLQFTFLIGRTWLSLIVARLDGMVIKNLVAANAKGVIRGIIYWLAIGIPASYTNVFIGYLQVKISNAFRTRLTRYVHDLYLNSKLPYYKVTSQDGGIEGPDQYITTDIARFCDVASSLFSKIGKPLIDMIIFNYQLKKSLGTVAMVMILANYYGTAWLLRKVSPPFGKLASREARLEGEYRSSHARIITNAEEIAFYNGAHIEKSILDRVYGSLGDHIQKVLKVRIPYNMLEDFTIKYAWSAYGLILCSIPIFLPSIGGSLGAQEKAEEAKGNSELERWRTGNFVTSKRLMLSLADAGGRLMYSYKDIAELAGYTARVFALLSTLHRIYFQAYDPPRGEKVEEFSLADVTGTVQEG